MLCLQEERFSPLRTFANAVPQEGIPKYDFLRNLLRNAAQPRDPKPSPKALASSSSAESDSGWTLPPSLDPLAALLQDAKQPWQNIDSKYDPFKALSRALASTEEPTGSTATLDPLGNLLKSDQVTSYIQKLNAALCVHICYCTKQLTGIATHNVTTSGAVTCH